nr:MAG TPA: hypothetical protein [Caudoviricetes sp.]
MNNMKALAHKLVAPFINDEQGPFETVGRWHRQLGRISLAMYQADDESYIHGGEYLYGELEFELSRMVEDAALLLHFLGVTDPVGEFLAEYERAAKKHPGMTLDSDSHTDESRFYALAEEVGEVCAALTYDNKADTGHNSDLISEVTQVGGLAIAWLSRFKEMK